MKMQNIWIEKFEEKSKELNQSLDRKLSIFTFTISIHHKKSKAEKKKMSILQQM